MQSTSSDNGYSLDKVTADLLQRIKGYPSYLKDGRYITNKGEELTNVKLQLGAMLTKYFATHNVRINEDAIEVEWSGDGNLTVHFRDEIVDSHVELEIFINIYRDAMGTLPPMTIGPVEMKRIILEVEVR